MGGSARRSPAVWPVPGWFAPASPVPGWFAPASLALAAAAALALPGHPAGLGLALVGFGLCVSAAAALPLRDAFAACCWVAAAALAATPVLLAATWVVVLSLLAALALAVVAASAGRTWRELGAALAGGAAALVPGPVVVLALAARRAGAHGWSRLVPAARGALLAALLLAVFVPLLSAADAAFADVVERVASWSPELDHASERAICALLALAVGGGLLLVGLHRRERPARPAPRRLGRTEWAIALGALDAVFAGFLAVQFATLFGGHEHVLETTGLSYAEYARRGFFELEVAGALTLAVVAAAARWAPERDRVARALVGVLCVLTLVMLASALRRLGLYEDAYGSTRLRMVAHAQLLWLGALFALVLVAGAAGDGARLPRAVVAVSAATALAFALSNPDRRIAERNVERFAETGRLDVRYLDGLSADAAPAIARLPPERAACAAQSVRWGLRQPDGLAGANIARARARRLLTPLPAVVC